PYILMQSFSRITSQARSSLSSEYLADARSTFRDSAAFLAVAPLDRRYLHTHRRLPTRSIVMVDPASLHATRCDCAAKVLTAAFFTAATLLATGPTVLAQSASQGQQRSKHGSSCAG